MTLTHLQGDTATIGVYFRSVPGDNVPKKIFVQVGNDAAAPPGQKLEFGPITQLSYEQEVSIVRKVETATLHISAYVQAEKPPKYADDVKKDNVMLTGGVIQQKVLFPIPPEPKLFVRKSHLAPKEEKYAAANPLSVVNLTASSQGCLDPKDSKNFFTNVRWEALDKQTAGLGYSWTYASAPEPLPREGQLGKSVCGTLSCMVTRPGDNCSYAGNIVGQEDVFDAWQPK